MTSKLTKQERKALLARGVLHCTRCHEIKPLSEFNKNKTDWTGYHTHCRPCSRLQQRESYRKDLDARRALRRSHANTDHEREARRRRNESDREIVRIKGRVHARVHAAMQRGELMRPAGCEVCGDAHRVEAHHDDYAKPLEVSWLCTACHRQRHIDLCAAGRDPDEMLRANPDAVPKLSLTGRKRRPEQIKRGEQNPSSRLTEEQVRRIRELVSNGHKRTDVAAMFSVSHSLVKQIVRREAWKHVA